MPSNTPGDERPPGKQQQRAQEKHEAKLQDIREQVAEGRLVIRQMTQEERERYPPREPRRERPPSRRGRG